MNPPVPESLTPPLAAVIARQLSRENVLQLIGSDSPTVRRIAVKWFLNHLVTNESILHRALEADGTVRLGALRLLCHPEIEATESLRRRVENQLQDADVSLRRAAVDVIVRRWPDDTVRALDLPQCRSDQSLLRSLCLADNPNLILPLMQAFEFPEITPPPTIGMLLSSAWLAEHHADQPRGVAWLIREFGYCEGDVTPDVLEMLSLGLSFTVSTMTASGPADKWVQRVRTLSWRLLSSVEEASAHDSTPLNLNDPVDVALFLAAVRDTDRLLFAERRTNPLWNPYRPFADPAPVCFHASSRYVRRMFVSDAFELAAKLKISDDQLGDFVIDHAKCELEAIPEWRVEARRNLRTQWRLRQLPDPKPRHLVIGDFRRRDPDPDCSPCAQSVCALAELAGLDAAEIGRWLSESEGRWSALLVPVGVELQIPKVDPDQFCPWKDALAFLGVPSPRRPEFGGTLEAAFRPARSWHSIVLAPLLLHRLGVISSTQAQDVALHISLQGDLDRHARYLAFPQLFIHPSQRWRHRPDAAMTRVMSKGLVHRNRDIEQLDPDVTNQPAVRTELRMFRLYSDEAGQQTVLATGYIEDMIATHLLGSAMLGSCSNCRLLADHYCEDVESEANSLGPDFEQLLHANYYESTGDPHDQTLMNQLGIFRIWASVRALIRQQLLHGELDARFQQCRSRNVERLINHLGRDHKIDWPAEWALAQAHLKALDHDPQVRKRSGQ